MLFILCFYPAGTNWYNAKTLYLAYDFIDSYDHLKENIEEISWIGEEEKSCSKLNLADCETYQVNTISVKQVQITLLLKINIEGVIVQSRVSKTVMMDVESPQVLDGSIIYDNNINTSNKRKVEFEITDNSGSGVSEYAVINGNTCNGLEYTQKKKSATDGIQTEYLGNGSYGICVKDKVGNLTSDGDLANSKNRFEVLNVDESKPVIHEIKINSTNASYNSLDVKLKLDVTDDKSVTGLKMCVSNTGYLKDCSWETYKTSKDFKLGGTYDGGVRTVYISVQDEAGNIANRTAKYTVYKNCSEKTAFKEVSNTSSSCPKCGTASYIVNQENYDKYFGGKCDSKKVSKSCNLPPCDIVVSMDPNDYESSKKVACNQTQFKRLINDFTAKFKSALDYQPFRYAIYDCASTTEPILRQSSQDVYDILRNHSRTLLMYGAGKSGSCSCYPNRTESKYVEACKSEKCSNNYDSLASGKLYNKKVLVLSQTSYNKSEQRDVYEPYGVYENEKHNFLLGADSNISVKKGFGYCNFSENGIINTKKKECNEIDNRTTSFLPNIRMGRLSVITSSLATDNSGYYTAKKGNNSNVYAQVFLIEDDGDPVKDMDPNNYESSKQITCEPYLFTRLVNNYTSKFKSALDYQAFRDAMYDCPSSTGKVLRQSSQDIYNILRNHSRTSIVSGRGKNASCECYYNKESNSAQKTCNKPACSSEYSQFVSGVLYNGRALILSATHNNALSTTYDQNGWGDWEDSGGNYEKEGGTFFLIGLGDDVFGDGKWGWKNRSNNAVYGSSGEYENRIASYTAGIQVGLHRWYNYSYVNSKGDETSSSRDGYKYYDSEVFVQFFKI